MLRPHELKAQIAELTKTNEELKFEESDLIRSFGKDSVSEMKDVQTDISSLESRTERLREQEEIGSAEIEKAVSAFRDLCREYADADPWKLAAERLSARPGFEQETVTRIMQKMSDHKISFVRMQQSIANADSLLAQSESLRLHSMSRETDRSTQQAQHRPRKAEEIR